MYNRKPELTDDIIRYLYFLTPAFMFLDYFCGLNIRISFLTYFPGYRFIYYIICGFIAFLIYRYPARDCYFALFENIINLTLNIIGFLYPYLDYTGIITLQSEDNLKIYDIQSVINFIISGTLIIISINILQYRLAVNSGRGI